MSTQSREIVVDETPGVGTMHVMYLLHLLAPFTAWLLAVVAVIIGMVKRDDVRGTWLESHVSWLSRTFWWGLLWVVICAAITFLLVITVVGVLVAWVPYTALSIWYLYRVIRGWLRLGDRKPAP
jgi:uncharacterized membrane protein